MKKMRKLHKESKKAENKDENKEQRQISKKEKWEDIKENRKMLRLRKNFIRKTKKLSSQPGRGYIYGPKYRFKARVPGVMGANKLTNNTFRTSVGTGMDHPLSFMFNEMQRQNKVQWAGKGRWVRAKKMSYYGPRYKTVTHIGKLHHGNVGKSLYDGIDDLNDGDLV